MVAGQGYQNPSKRGQSLPTARVPFAKKSLPFPIDRDSVALLHLADGRVLPDTSVWRGFMQDELGVDPGNRSRPSTPIETRVSSQEKP